VKLLLDTNIVIPLEPTHHDDFEGTTEAAASLISLAQSAGVNLYIHPDTLIELSNDTNAKRWQSRKILLNKYPRLQSPPQIPSNLSDIIGKAKEGSHDEIDNKLLSAVFCNAVDFLVTQDHNIHRKANLLNLDERITTIHEAIVIIQKLFPKSPLPPPAVKYILSYELIDTDQIFDSFRQDYYPDFDEWLARCKREHRPAWIIENEDASYAGICIVKHENAENIGLTKNTLKICSLKVSDKAFGGGFGELLLKTVFDYVKANSLEYIYITVYEKYGGLIKLLEEFGFNKTTLITPRGEIILSKPFIYSDSEYNKLSPLEFNIRYGPSEIKYEDTEIFIIPIQPRYHKLLFPDIEDQFVLFPGGIASGNAIRKAYLSNAKIKKIKPGSILLFYRSHDKKAIYSIGVVDKTRRSINPDEVAAFVGKRTVYSFSDITQLCDSEVLAILFRYAKRLNTPIRLEDLEQNAILESHPQSIVKISSDKIEWLRNRINL
jgi:hypothetical protein